MRTPVKNNFIAPIIWSSERYKSDQPLVRILMLSVKLCHIPARFSQYENLTVVNYQLQQTERRPSRKTVTLGSFLTTAAMRKQLQLR
ncbi:hypothetical protein H8959_006387 [Pygathrix nigripes]